MKTSSGRSRDRAEKIRIFTTGGTIDKVYFDARSDYEVGEPQIVDILREAGVSFSWRLETLLRKDSLDLTDADRALIAERVRADRARRILITHGTDTMVRTAQAIGDIRDKTVVLVGSLSPARFKHSDAEFNIGFALGAVQSLPPGVYIAMNGRIFDPRRVRKNRRRNRFEEQPSAVSHRPSARRCRARRHARGRLKADR